MIVFEYLYGMMDVFNPLMDEYAVKNIDVDEMVRKIIRDYSTLASCITLFICCFYFVSDNVEVSFCRCMGRVVTV